jgi:hypothetical protein
MRNSPVTADPLTKTRTRPRPALPNQVNPDTNPVLTEVRLVLNED